MLETCFFYLKATENPASFVLPWNTIEGFELGDEFELVGFMKGDNT